MSNSSSPKELKLDLTLTDSRAIEIVESIPQKQRNEIIEKYIVLGEMVVSHASIATRKETVEAFFAPLRSDIDMIREQLARVVPTMTTPARKGEVTEESIFLSLQEHFMDDSFENVSRSGKYTDILATTYNTEIPVLIELKDYKGTVPSEEVGKFWRDLERRGTRYGIFISMRSKIAKCSGAISIKTEMNKTGLFVVNSELNWLGHIFAYYVIKKITELEIKKKEELKGKELGKAIVKVNNYVLELQKQVESIDEIQDIADSLKTTCRKKLDALIDLSNRYKRTLNDKIGEILDEIGNVKI
jgi:hypothetical protein